jgi:esterase/lipase superfamily enzyme
MAKYYMISLRDNGGVGVDRNQDGPTYWLSDTDDIENIINWREVELGVFRDAIINAADQFPVVPAAHHEDQKHVALAVHGYNISWIASIGFYKSLCQRLFLEGANLGICVLLTWPSKGEVYDYLPDRDEVRKCAGDLADVMAAFYYNLAQTRSPAASGSGNVCKAKVSIIAHSLGNFLIQVAMFLFWKRINSPLGLSFVNQLLMVAADVDNDLFDTATLDGDGDGEGVADLAYRVTAFYSGRDPILGVSAGLKHFLKRRLGRSGLDRTTGGTGPATPDNVWDTDCTDFFNDADVSTENVHGAYFDTEPVLRLMTQVLQGVDRAILVKNGTASQNSWWPNRAA